MYCTSGSACAHGSCPYHTIPTSILALIRWVSAPSDALIRHETDQTHAYQLRTRDASVEACFLTTPGGVKPPLGRKVTTADADHCRTLKAIGSAEDSCCALNRLQWVRNGLTLFTADDYNSKVLSERGGAGQRVGYTKTGLRASPNRITPESHYRPRKIAALALCAEKK